MPAPTVEFRPRPISRHRWVVLGIIAAVTAVLYFLVVHFYDAQGALTSSNTAEPTTAGISVTVEPMEVKAATNQATIYLTYKSVDPTLVDSGDRLLENVRIITESQTGMGETRFPAGSILSPTTVMLALDGEIAEYPFDTHRGSGTISAETYVKNKDGTFTTKDPIYVYATAQGGVNGWGTVVDIEETAVDASMTITFDRAFSTQVFALMLLALAVMLAASTLVVAFLVSTSRRKAEIGLMSWTAALLFALPALRTFMPNAPPIGASIDMYVYLWVMAGAIAAAIIMIVSWMRQSARILEAENAADNTGD